MGVKETLNEILDTVAFQKDADGNEISILAKAKEDLEEFLSEHTSISDDEKAKRISDFFTNTITNVTVQAIMVAGQAPLQDAQIAEIQQDTINKTNESVQKVISMQNEDKARLNDSAVNVAKAKADIETLIPAQVQEINKNIAIKDKELLQADKKLDIMDKDITLKETQNTIELKKVDVMTQDIAVKTAQVNIEEKKLPLIEAQTNVETKKLDIMAQDELIKKQEVDIKTKQVDIETKKLDLMDKDILLKGKQVVLEEKKIPLMEAQTNVETKKLDLMEKDIAVKQSQIDLDAEKIPLMQTQLETEQEKLGLLSAQSLSELEKIQLLSAQTRAVGRSLEVNRDIEHCKCETSLKIAEIQATSL